MLLMHRTDCEESRMLVYAKWVWILQNDLANLHMLRQLIKLLICRRLLGRPGLAIFRLQVSNTGLVRSGDLLVLVEPAVDLGILVLSVTTVVDIGRQVLSCYITLGFFVTGLVRMFLVRALLTESIHAVGDAHVNGRFLEIRLIALLKELLPICIKVRRGFTVCIVKYSSLQLFSR